MFATQRAQESSSDYVHSDHIDEVDSDHSDEAFSMIFNEFVHAESPIMSPLPPAAAKPSLDAFTSIPASAPSHESGSSENPSERSMRPFLPSDLGEIEKEAAPSKAAEHPTNTSIDDARDTEPIISSRPTAPAGSQGET